jgi:hypothetical protein
VMASEDLALPTELEGFSLWARAHHWPSLNNW